MWTVIAVMIACSAPGKCQPMVGQHMTFMQCMSMSQVMMADFYRQFPHFDPKLGRIMCVEPRRLDAVLGRNLAMTSIARSKA
jgi:hypothetical protein